LPWKYNITWYQPFFLLTKFREKENFKIIKVKNLKMKWLWRFSIARSEGKNSKIFQISIFGFQCVAKDMEGWFKFDTSYMVYSHIWLNIPKNDCHFFYIFLLMIVTLAKKRNPQKKHCLTCKLNSLVTKSSLGCNIWRKKKVLGYRTKLMWSLLSFGTGEQDLTRARLLSWGEKAIWKFIS